MTNEQLVQELLLGYKEMYHQFLENLGVPDNEAMRGGFYVNTLLPVVETEELPDDLKLALLSALIRIATGSMEILSEQPNAEKVAREVVKLFDF